MNIYKVQSVMDMMLKLTKEIREVDPKLAVKYILLLKLLNDLLEEKK